MYQIDFEQPKRIHFIGIGGISMSGLAEILITEGFRVSGSDSNRTRLTEHLQALGAEVFIGQRAQNITDDIEVVVYTAAVHPDNPEYAATVEKGIPILSRAELLGQLMKNYGEAIAVSGTHGKTTTTAMISEILLTAGKEPTISIGGIMPSIGGNIRVGGSDCFVTEACEYTNSFLHFFPTTAVILNVREDHLDFFKDLQEIRDSFRQFSELIPEGGLLVINRDIQGLEELIDGLVCRVETYSVDDTEADYYAGNLVMDEDACGTFDVMRHGESMGRISLKAPGTHNVANALAAIAVADSMGVCLEDMQVGFDRFQGVQRRFEKKGVVGGVEVFDDYAHHPDEIRATLTMANQVKKGKLWCVFQPHTYTRTKSFLAEFAEALSLADEVVLAKIYAAREVDTLGVSSEDVARLLRQMGKKATYLETFGEIEDFLLQNCVHSDLLITMGAGDVVKVGESLLGK
ncbi:MAG: UDP-N-acetylmuramate--L-alanine ligase [Lachnospiraceae bacterium]|nr:UDP-N-acetylmuramate--L-alanine ligase [Lachnospiraceae bacterium]